MSHCRRVHVSHLLSVWISMVASVGGTRCLDRRLHGFASCLVVPDGVSGDISLRTLPMSTVSVSYVFLRSSPLLKPNQIPNRCTPLLLALPMSKRAAGHLGYLSSIRTTMASAADDDVDGDSLSAQGARKARAMFLCLFHNPVYEAHTLSSQ